MWSHDYHRMIRSLRLNILDLHEDAMDTKITSLARQFVAILSCYRSIAAPSIISHHAIDFECNFITSHIKFVFGAYTVLQVWGLARFVFFNWIWAEELKFDAIQVFRKNSVSSLHRTMKSARELLDHIKFSLTTCQFGFLWSRWGFCGPPEVLLYLSYSSVVVQLLGFLWFLLMFRISFWLFQVLMVLHEVLLVLNWCCDGSGWWEFVESSD